MSMRHPLDPGKEAEVGMRPWAGLGRSELESTVHSSGSEAPQMLLA